MVRSIFSLLFLFSCFQITTFGMCDDSDIIGFHLECREGSSNCIKLTCEADKKPLSLEKTPALSVNDIASAEVEAQEPSAEAKELFKELGRAHYAYTALLIKFTPEAKDKFLKVTSDNINKRLGVIIDGKLLVAPIIKEPITEGEAQIVGNLEKEELISIAQRINQLVDNKNSEGITREQDAQ